MGFRMGNVALRAAAATASATLADATQPCSELRHGATASSAWTDERHRRRRDDTELLRARDGALEGKEAVSPGMQWSVRGA